MHRSIITLILAVLSLQTFAQSTFPVNNLQMKWEVVENGYMGKAQTLSRFTLINKSRQMFPASGWTIYYNFIRFVTPAEAAPGVRSGHVNGHLYTFSPVEGFKGIRPGDSLTLKIVHGAWITARTDAPEAPYIVFNGKGYTLPYTIIPSTQTKQLMRTAADKHVQATPEDVYKKNSVIKNIPLKDLPPVFPTPINITNGEGSLELTPQTIIYAHPELKEEAVYLADMLGERLGKPVTIATNSEGATIRLTKVPRITGATTETNYTLMVSKEGIGITGEDAAAVFYGIQSLRQLIPLTGKAVVPAVNITDGARFAFRSLLIDVARNFQSKQEMMRVIDLMSVYKLNVLHLHMSDDEGWRIAIPGLPELTEVGGRRGHTVDEMDALQPSYGSGPDADNTTGSGFYTKEEYIELIRYAAARHIKIIPEIEMPGHGRAAIKAMDARYAKLMKAGRAAEAAEFRLSDPDDKSTYKSVQEWKDNVMNVAPPSTYKFIEKVVDELAAMHKEAGAPLDIIHMGGDETPAGVWEKSPVAMALMQKENIQHVDDLWHYFYDKVAKIVNARGMQIYGWEEMGMRRIRKDGRTRMVPNPDLANRNFQLDVWNNVMGAGAEDLTYKLANMGYKVVISGVSNLYFDMAYLKNYDEPGFYWGGYVDVDKPFYLIPLDMYRNSTEDDQGNPLPAGIFEGKERLTETGSRNIVGIQAALWSETIKGPAQLEYLLLPKLLGMAERAWAADPAWAKEEDRARSVTLYNQAWSEFANVLGKKELPRLATLNGGYNYRIPTAGAMIRKGKVLANVQLPGMLIRYTTNGKEPTAKSPVYTTPVAGRTVKLKVYDSAGRSGRTVTVRP